MGNDGGSIPTRRELVKEAARALTTTQLKETQTEAASYAWSTDPITLKTLSLPVVSDCAGKLYNKDTILEYLLPSDDEAAKLEAEKVLEGRVKSMKDVVEVKFEIESGVDSVAERSAEREVWVCPVSGRELGPGAKAVYLVPCGHAFAGSVVREVSAEGCLQCNEAYTEDDIIPILSTVPTDITRLALRMKTLKEKGLTHSLKKALGSKKRKKNAEKESAAAGPDLTDETKTKSTTKDEMKSNKPTVLSPSTSTPRPQVQPSTNKSAPSYISNGIKNAATASLTAKVLEEQEARNKRRKMENNESIKSLYSSRNSQSGKSSDFMTRGFSIPANGKR